MKAISDRLEWVRFYMNGTTPGTLGREIAVEELNLSISVAEAFGMKSIVERLEKVRDWFNGVTTDRDAAFDTLIEAMAIADALPEVTITIPSDEASRTPPERIIDLP
jgi:hypothetical protein